MEIERNESGDSRGLSPGFSGSQTKTARIARMSFGSARLCLMMRPEIPAATTVFAAACLPLNRLTRTTGVAVLRVAIR